MKPKKRPSKTNFIKSLFQGAGIYLFGKENKNVNRLTLWTGLLALWTIVLVYLSTLTLKDYRESRNADFIQKLHTNFFSKDAQQLIMLLEYDLLEFKENNTAIDTVVGLPKDFGCFIIIKKFAEINHLLIDTTKTLYSSYEIDDILLNKLNQIATLQKNSIIKFKDVYQTFRFYIGVVVENSAIKKYMTWLSKKYRGESFFKNLLDIYKKIK